MELNRFPRLLHEVFRPDPWRLLLGLLTAFISLAGATQTYVFIDEVPGMEPPPLYPYIQGLDFWIPWLILTLPLWAACMVDGWCTWLVSLLPGMGAVKVPLFSMAYGYLESSWAVYVWGRWAGPRGAGKPLLLTSLALTSIIYGPALASSLMGFYPLSRSLSGALLSLLVISLHMVSLYGLYVAVGRLTR